MPDPRMLAQGQQEFRTIALDFIHAERLPPLVLGEAVWRGGRVLFPGDPGRAAWGGGGAVARPRSFSAVESCRILSRPLECLIGP